jgi:hypothetical protein
MNGSVGLAITLAVGAARFYSSPPIGSISIAEEIIHG